MLIVLEVCLLLILFYCLQLQSKVVPYLLHLLLLLTEEVLQLFLAVLTYLLAPQLTLKLNLPDLARKCFRKHSDVFELAVV